MFTCFAGVALAVNVAERGVPSHSDPSDSQGAKSSTCLCVHSLIGKRCRIGPFTFIGEDVEIGDDTIIGSNATLVNCTIGNHVVLHAGVRIGQDGFGFQLASSGDHAKKPQELRVEIHDYVEIGHVAPLLWGMIQIGHNVQLGKGCVIAAQTGIAGSTTLGNNVHIGGQVGIAQHLQIGDNVRIAAKSGVMNHLASDATYGKVNTFESMIAEEKADVVPLYHAIQEERLPYRSWSSAVKWRI
ncbi:Udp-3-o-[3-hydroxymyristoyl] glucosamine n-acyltransferase, partial [Globisporangium splendens]